jgi:hypothetical protein
MNAVSLTPHAQQNFRTTLKSENHIQYKTVMVWKKLKMHAVSMTPHSRCMRCHWHHMHKKNFWTTSKSENHVQNGDGMQKKSKMHAVSMTPHSRCMRCYWHRMHCTMHGVSLTQHARVYEVSMTSTNGSNSTGSGLAQTVLWIRNRIRKNQYLCFGRIRIWIWK